ncbi:MAG: BolA/IbaG family iron-sulfur metabolism protein [Gammaproteobacteria bacterium]|jgi:BolA family transcriptional regulator, general stress-responsive regulator|nr:BolA/IbaG family iron-sulfur metabolism protein [Gammaproteobacteria bacterium]
MVIENDIRNKLQSALQPEHLEVINESNNHSVPPGSESHFKVVIVSNEFSNKQLVARHRLINKILAEELAGSIHALALHTLTPEEWAATGTAPASPPCMGGGKVTG